MYLEIDFEKFNPLKDDAPPFWGFHEIPDIAEQARAYLKNFNKNNFEEALIYIEDEIGLIIDEWRQQDPHSKWDDITGDFIEDGYSSREENYYWLLREIDWYETDKLNPDGFKGYQLFSVLALAYLSHSYLGSSPEERPAFMINASSSISHAEFLKFGSDFDMKVINKNRQAAHVRHKKHNADKQKVYDFLSQNHDDLKNLSIVQIVKKIKPKGHNDFDFVSLQDSTIKKYIREYRKKISLHAE